MWFRRGAEVRLLQNVTVMDEAGNMVRLRAGDLCIVVEATSHAFDVRIETRGAQHPSQLPPSHLLTPLLSLVSAEPPRWASSRRPAGAGLAKGQIRFIQPLPGRPKVATSSYRAGRSLGIRSPLLFPEPDHTQAAVLGRVVRMD